MEMVNGDAGVVSCGDGVVATGNNIVSDVNNGDDHEKWWRSLSWW